MWNPYAAKLMFLATILCSAHNRKWRLCCSCRDGGGSIGEEELGKVMRTFGWDPKEEELKVPHPLPLHILNCRWPNLFQEMVSVIDQDGDGDISFNEFVWLMTK